MLQRFTPHPYQVDGIAKIIEHEQLALWWDCGLGKTVTTLTALAKLKYEYFAIGRILIIAPLKVAESTWQTEAESWEHLKGRFSIVSMLGDQQTRARALRMKADITVVNRDNVTWLVDYCYQHKIDWPYDTIVIDEASSFKNPSSKRFKALKKIRPAVRRVIELTGTPTTRELGDLWAQLYLLDMGERLYPTVTQFRNRYYSYNTYSYTYTPYQGSEERIMSSVSDICFSLSADDYLSLPDYLEEDVRVALSPKQLGEYKNFEKTFVLKLLSDENSDTISATSAGVLSNKLLQYASGAVYDELGEAHDIHTEKCKAFGELVETSTEPILVYYTYRFDLERIEAELTKQKKVYRVYKSDDDLRLWNEGKLDVLVASPQSCAYGLNLQHGGRRVLWYTMPWSHEVYTQANARLYRQGQTKPVIVQRLITTGTYDERVSQVLTTKADLHQFVMEYVKSVI